MNDTNNNNNKHECTCNPSPDDTSVLIGRMTWVGLKNEWHLETEMGRDNWILLQEFFNCSSIGHYFKGLNKDKAQNYNIVIKREL